MDPSSPSGGALDRAKRLLFPSDAPSSSSPSSPGQATAADADAAAIAATVERIVSARLGDAVDAIHETASSVMHEIAAEVWRTAGGDKREVQAKILESLARDDALRGLIAHSDERFQALAVRTGRLEDILERLAADTETATETVQRSVSALETAVAQPALVEVGDLRERLANVVHQISRALASITERDRILVEAISERVETHGKVVTDETGRIAAAMEAYVQQGVSALGQLAGRVDAQLAEFQGRFEARVEEQVRQLDEELQRLHEQAGIESRDVKSQLEANERRTREWIVGLARLVRADAQTLRDEMVRQINEQDERISRATTSIEETTERAVHDITRRFREDTDAGLARIEDSQRAMLQQRLDEALSTLDRNMIRMGDHLEGQLDRLGDVVGAQAAQASSAIISSRVDEAMELIRSSQDDVQKAVEDKITGLARFIRSDNRVLADRVRQLAEQDTARQALRAVKEMQANLPDEILRVVEMRIEAVADRFHRDIQETTESIAKIGAALERKTEQLTARMAQRQDKQMQVVVERMGDAMHALASLNRPLPSEDRIEID
jgi:hypothetical protein